MPVLYAVVEKRDMPHFLNNIVSRYDVIAPVRKEHTYIFDEVSNPKEIALKYDNTLLPPKKFFLPSREVILKYNLKNEPKVEVDTDFPSKVFFGLHPCDIKGLLLLDQVFSGRYRDPYYLKRRARTIIIGLGCMPQAECFCQSMGAEEVEAGFDLFFIDLDDRYFVRIATADGDHILRRNTKFREVGSKDFNRFRQASRRRSQLFKLVLDQTGLPDFLDLAFESKVWGELGEKCINCGACSYVCPTCYCFDIQDDLEVNLLRGERVRRWESCLLEEFAEVAGGFNFRPDRSSRFKNRFYHKHKGFVEVYGRPACVGCGRCIRACLPRINVVEVMKVIRGEQVGKKQAYS